MDVREDIEDLKKDRGDGGAPTPSIDVRDSNGQLSIRLLLLLRDHSPYRF